MKKISMIMAVLVAAFVAFQGAALAGTVEGTVNSVDIATKSMAVSSDAGSSSVTYADTTAWPAGVTDPASLVGKKVKVTTDDVSGQATSVEEAMAM